MTTGLKERIDIEQKEKLSHIDYESSGSGQLEVTITDPMLDQFIHPNSADDSNVAHSATEYMKSRICRKLGSRIVPGMQLSAIAEVFAYYNLMANLDMPKETCLSGMDIRFGLPVIPNVPILYSVIPNSAVEVEGNYSVDLIVRDLEPCEGKNKPTKRVRNCSMRFSPLKKMDELVGGEPIIDRVLTEQNLDNYLESIDYTYNFMENPSVFQIASTVSRALIKKGKQMKSNSAVYTQLGFTNYDTPFNLGERLKTFVQEDKRSTKEDAYIVTTTNPQNQILLEVKTTIRF